MAAGLVAVGSASCGVAVAVGRGGLVAVGVGFGLDVGGGVLRWRRIAGASGVAGDCGNRLGGEEHGQRLECGLDHGMVASSLRFGCSGWWLRSGANPCYSGVVGPQELWRISRTPSLGP